MTFHLANNLCTDPVGQVYISSGGVYRGIFKNREAFIKTLLQSEAFEMLLSKGLLVSMKLSDTPLPGYRLVVESAVMPFDIPCHYFDRRTLLKCVLVWLEANAILLQRGYSLGDCHFGNFMLCGKNQPKLIDLGSIHAKPVTREGEGFPLMDLFFKEMLSPVLVMYRCQKYSRLARLVIEDAPINGPLYAQGDAVADLSDFVCDEITMLKEKVSHGDEMKSIQVLIDYLTPLLEVPLNDENIATTVPSLKKYDMCGESVLCIGSDLFASVEQQCSDAEITVVDWSADQLEILGQEIEQGTFNSENRVSLVFAHPLNRKFMAHGLSASYVVAHLPFDKFRHHSFVMNENIALALSSLADERLIVSVKPEESHLMDFLTTHFTSVASLSRSAEVVWYVCEKKDS